MALGNGPQSPAAPVAVATAAAPAFADQDSGPLSLDLAGNLRTTAVIGGTITVAPENSSTVTAHAQTAVGVVAVVLLAANASRKRFMVQNTGTTTIKLGFTSTDPTQTSYHVALSSGAPADSGRGGTYMDDLWIGTVEAISSVAGGTVVVTEMT